MPEKQTGKSTKTDSKPNLKLKCFRYLLSSKHDWDCDVEVYVTSEYEDNNLHIPIVEGFLRNTITSLDGAKSIEPGFYKFMLRDDKSICLYSENKPKKKKKNTEVIELWQINPNASHKIKAKILLHRTFEDFEVIVFKIKDVLEWEGDTDTLKALLTEHGCYGMAYMNGMWKPLIQSFSRKKEIIKRLKFYINNENVSGRKLNNDDIEAINEVIIKLKSKKNQATKDNC